MKNKIRIIQSTRSILLFSMDPSTTFQQFLLYRNLFMEIAQPPSLLLKKQWSIPNEKGSTVDKSTVHPKMIIASGLSV